MNKNNNNLIALINELLNSGVATAYKQCNCSANKPTTNTPKNSCNCCNEDDMPPLRNLIKKVIFNNPATIVYWADGSKTVVKCSEDDEYVPETGVAMAILKYIIGGSYYRQITKVVDELGFDATTVKANKRKAKKAKAANVVADTNNATDTDTSVFSPFSEESVAEMAKNTEEDIFGIGNLHATENNPTNIFDIR